MKHVIHVDNSVFFRKLMKTFLSEKGLECESFENGEEAISAVTDGRASFIITGLELADMTGDEFFKRLMALPHKIPIIVVTSTDVDAKNKRMEALGVKAVIMKSDDWKAELGKILRIP